MDKRVLAVPFLCLGKGLYSNRSVLPEEKSPFMLKYAKDFGGASTQIVVTYEVFEDAIKTEEALYS